MSGFVGADVEQLRSMATSLDGEADRLTSALEAVTREVDGVPWFGPASEEFNGLWHELHRPAAVAAVVVLSDMAGKLRANADAQEQTSADLGGSAGAVGSTAGPAPSVVPVAAQLALPGRDGDEDAPRSRPGTPPERQVGPVW